MSRLIDADELKKAFIGNRYGTKAIEYVIDDVPTVKAIPVEWIKDYVGFGVSDDTFQRNRRFVLNMIEDWEKENGEDSE